MPARDNARSFADWLAKKAAEAQENANRPAAKPQPGGLRGGANITRQLAQAAAITKELKQPVAADDSTVARLTEKACAELGRLARPDETLSTGLLRQLRRIEADANARWPRAEVVRRVGDEAWSALFFDAPFQPASWTRARATSLVTRENWGTDELLVRAAIAHAVVHPDKNNPLQPILDLWRHGVVPDVSGHTLVARRNGAVVSEVARPGRHGLS